MIVSSLCGYLTELCPLPRTVFGGADPRRNHCRREFSYSGPDASAFVTSAPLVEHHHQPQVRLHTLSATIKLPPNEPATTQKEKIDSILCRLWNICFCCVLEPNASNLANWLFSNKFIWTEYSFQNFMIRNKMFPWLFISYRKSLQIVNQTWIFRRSSCPRGLLCIREAIH